MALDETLRIKASENEAKFYLKKVDAVPTEAVQFTADDLIVALTDAGEFGHTVKVTESKYVHQETTVKTRGEKSLKDINYTEAMFYEQMKERQKQSYDGDLIVVGSFTKENEPIYGYCGTINDFTGSFSGEAGTVKYTYSPSVEVKVLAPEA